MLSRRSVRIKIMQVLYGASVSDEVLTPEVAEKYYRRKVEESYELYLFVLLQLQRVVGYTSHDAAYRANKQIQTPADRSFDSRLQNNPIAKNLYENIILNQALHNRKLLSLRPTDLIKQFYYGFIKTEVFETYNNLPLEEVTNEQNLQILLDLLKYLLNDEAFCDIMEDAFSNWEDDKSLVVGAAKRSIKALGEDTEYIHKFIPDEEVINDFGSELLYKVVYFNDQFNGRINEKLENWDAERVNRIDRILLLMILGELQYCPSIPVKVTLDEYIELSKIYSTEKSKEFVNGIADKLMRDLMAENLIHKVGRGLVQ